MKSSGSNSSNSSRRCLLTAKLRDEGDLSVVLCVDLLCLLALSPPPLRAAVPAAAVPAAAAAAATQASPFSGRFLGGRLQLPLQQTVLGLLSEETAAAATRTTTAAAALNTQAPNTLQ